MRVTFVCGGSIEGGGADIMRPGVNCHVAWYCSCWLAGRRLFGCKSWLSGNMSPPSVYLGVNNVAKAQLFFVPDRILVAKSDRVSE